MLPRQGIILDIKHIPKGPPLNIYNARSACLFPTRSKYTPKPLRLLSCHRTKNSVEEQMQIPINIRVTLIHRLQPFNQNKQTSVANTTNIVSFQSEKLFEDLPNPSNACTLLPVAVPSPEPEMFPRPAKLVA